MDPNPEIKLQICPICSSLEENVSDHLMTHSKEEIISIFSRKDALSSNNENIPALHIGDNNSGSFSQTSEVFNRSVPESNSTSLCSGVQPMVFSDSTSLPINSNKTLLCNSVLSAGSTPSSGESSLFIQNGLTNIFNGAHSSNSIPNTYNLPNYNIQNTNYIPNLLGSNVKKEECHINTANCSENINHYATVLPISQNNNISFNSQNILNAFVPNQPVMNMKNGVNVLSLNLLQSNVNNRVEKEPILFSYPLNQMAFPSSSVFVNNQNIFPLNEFIPQVIPQQKMCVFAGNDTIFNTSQYMKANAINPVVSQMTVPIEKQSDNGSQSFIGSLSSKLNSPSESTSGTQKITNNGDKKTLEKVDCVDKRVEADTKCKDIAVEVGESVKILLPRKVLENKEMAKELINKELVHALVLNEEDNFVLHKTKSQSEQSLSHSLNTNKIFKPHSSDSAKSPDTGDRNRDSNESTSGTVEICVKNESDQAAKNVPFSEKQDIFCVKDSIQNNQTCSLSNTSGSGSTVACDNIEQIRIKIKTCMAPKGESTQNSQMNLKMLDNQNADSCAKINTFEGFNKFEYSDNEYVSSFTANDDIEFHEENPPFSISAPVCNLNNENAESNDTTTEEVMSLKASEILADSDSEGATNSEEMSEEHFKKSCIFASQDFPRNEDHVEKLDICQVKSEKKINDSTLSGSDCSDYPDDVDILRLTLDGNCSILPVDYMHISQVFEMEPPLMDAVDTSFLKKEIKIDAEVPSHESASTSGLQVVVKVKKNDAKAKPQDEDSEEYDFDFESDGYESESENSSNMDNVKVNPSTENVDSLITKDKKFEDESESKGELCDDIKVDSILISMDSFVFKCNVCDMNCKSREKLIKHRVLVLTSRRVCPFCHLKFHSPQTRRRHMKDCGEWNLSCTTCHRKFESVSTWTQDQLHHYGQVKFECKICAQRCKNKSDLAQHARMHNGDKPFKCEICARKFTFSDNLKRHMFVHVKGLEVECDICHKSFKNAFCLSKHKVSVHHVKKRGFIRKRTDFICNICEEVFHSSKKLNWHLEKHEKWPKKCHICGESFVHTSYLTKHIRLKHNSAYVPSGSEKETSICKICSKAYKKSSMALHMRIHTGAKPYKCDVCDKEFNIKCNFMLHKWTHSDVRERPYKCSYCDKSFYRRRFFDDHVRSHKEIKPYTCNECGKSFTYKSNYQIHLKLHRGEKSFKCSHCGKSFHRKYNRDNHVRIHTGETPFECTICNKVFTQKSNYNVHMKAFHVERQPIQEEV